jgi:hypothetical protein
MPHFFGFLRQEGFFRLWRGAPAVVLGSIPSHAAYFSMYEAAKDVLGVNKPGHHPAAAALTGALSTSVHDFISTPTDMVKQRLQLGYYNGLVHCLKTISTEEGVLSLWRSYPTTLLMNVPYAAVVVSANESFKKFLTPVFGPLNLTTYIISGALAGSLAAAATCPLDVLKTRLQTQGLASRHNGTSIKGNETGCHHHHHHHHSTADTGNNNSNSNTNSSSSSSVTNTSQSHNHRNLSSSSSSSSSSSLSSPHSKFSPSLSNSSSSSSSSSSTSSSLSSAVSRLAAAAGHGGGHNHHHHPPGHILQVALLSTQPSSRLPPLSAIEVAKSMWREEGVGAFFKGIRARVAIHAPSQAISWATYEAVKAFLINESNSKKRIEKY